MLGGTLSALFSHGGGVIPEACNASFLGGGVILALGNASFLVGGAILAVGNASSSGGGSLGGTLCAFSLMEAD